MGATLSVSMIVKNEEILLGKCLESVKEADEIVIVDTGSTDSTGEIARRYTSKYIVGEYLWNDNFAEARNFAISKCSGDWILTIDADEFLEEGGIEKIRNAIASAGNFRTITCWIVAVNGKSKHVQPRVYKRDPKIFWIGAIHNYLSLSEGNIQDIKIFYDYSPAHAADPDRALRILKREVEKNPNSAREKYYLAREYYYRKDYITALYWYDQYLKIATWAPEIADAWLMKAYCLFQLYRGDEARDACIQAIKINTNFKEAIQFMAEISGPGNSKRWKEFAKGATNEAVLFIRERNFSEKS